MTITQVTLGMNGGTSSYGPFPHGSHAGTPIIDFSVSESETNQRKIRSIQSLFENWNWETGLSSGFSRIQFRGENVFKEQHREGITELSRILNARFVDFELSSEELQQRPPRELKNLADYYRVFVPGDRDFDRDVLEYYSNQAKSYGNVDFLFKIGKWNDDDYVSEIVREFNIYDSDVWLYPKGRKVDTVAERIEMATQQSKRRNWNVSPRIDIFQNVDTDE